MKIVIKNALRISVITVVFDHFLVLIYFILVVVHPVSVIIIIFIAVDDLIVVFKQL